LGLLDVQVWRATPRSLARSISATSSIEQKESAKWLRSFEAVTAVQRRLPATTVVSVGDREADIYELFVAAVSQPGTPKLLVRAERDRLVADGQGHLWTQVESQPLAGLQALRVPRRTASPAWRSWRSGLRWRGPQAQAAWAPHVWAVQALETAGARPSNGCCRPRWRSVA
jgi:hypothetical protein